MRCSIQGSGMAEARAITVRTGPRPWLSGLWLTLMALAAIFAPLIVPHDPLAQDLMLGKMPPAWMAGAEPGYLLGTDSLGRDVLSRLFSAARPALIVAIGAGLAACVLGSVLGLLAGFFGGWTDRIVSRIVDIWMAFPPVLLSILLVAFLNPSLTSVIIAIAIIDWTRFCRVVRAETMQQRRMDYVE